MRFQNRLVLLACSVLLCFLSDILFRFPTVRSFQIPDYPESILYQEFFFNIQNEKMCILLSNDRFNVGCSREAYDNAVLVPVETEDHMQDLKKRLSESEMQYAVILSSSYYGTRGLSETISIFNNTSTVVGVYINRLKDESTPEKSGAQPNFMYPNASGINWNYYTFSLILLDDDATFDQVMFRAKENFQKAYEGLLTRIEQNYAMNAIGQNATTCLNNETCSPLGSHSVWAATKPVTHNTLKQQYVVLATKITSTSLFHQEVPAVRDVIAPLAAVLSVVESLLHFPVFTDETQKDVLPIVFAFFSGEEYDRLGSQRFVEEVGKFSCEEPGYNQDYPRHACINPWYRHTNFTDFRLDHIRYFIEMGPISLSNNSYYIMEPPEKSENTDTRRALEEAFAHIGAKASESSAFPRDYAVTSFENIGERAIYTEFQHEDPSSVHQTIYDTSKAVCTECIQRHATNLLLLLTTLTGAASVLGEENLGTLTVNPSLVTKWMLCLTDGTYDACPEVLNYLNITVLGTLEDPRSVLIPKTFYPGVFEFGRVSVVPQFLQVFLADKFALRRGAPCLEDDLELACSGAEMCVLGQCVLAESYLQHAYATSIRFNATSGTFSALPGISNGTWTESFWSAGVGSRVFHAESSKKEAGYLFGAIGSCVLVVLLLFLHENYAIPLIQK